MRVVRIIIITVILAFSFSGCLGEVTTNKVNSGSPTVKPTAPNTKEQVTIKPSNEKPLSLKNKNTILLEGLSKGEEYIEVVVDGEIFDFEQVALSWDESKSELKEKEIVKSIKTIKNQTLVIKTYQPETIPTEKIKWKSRTGKTYEYIIAYSGKDENSITKFEIK